MQMKAPGFHIVHPFDTALVPELAVTQRLGYLIGNTRDLWPYFLEARRDEPDPFDRFVERSLEAQWSSAAHIFYAHRKYNGSFLPFQRIAVDTGLGALAPSRLVVHPIYGPWFALRAIVVMDGDPPPRRAPIAQPCTCAAECTAALDAARADPSNAAAWIAVRDACSLRAMRYTDEQIAYHYSHAFPVGNREHSSPSGE